MPTLVDTLLLRSSRGIVSLWRISCTQYDNLEESPAGTWTFWRVVDFPFRRTRDGALAKSRIIYFRHTSHVKARLKVVSTTKDHDSFTDVSAEEGRGGTCFGLRHKMVGWLSVTDLPYCWWSVSLLSAIHLAVLLAWLGGLIASNPSCFTLHLYIVAQNEASPSTTDPVPIALFARQPLTGVDGQRYRCLCSSYCLFTIEFFVGTLR